MSASGGSESRRVKELVDELVNLRRRGINSIAPLNERRQPRLDLPVIESLAAELVPSNVDDRVRLIRQFLDQRLAQFDNVAHHEAALIRSLFFSPGTGLSPGPDGAGVLLEAAQRTAHLGESAFRKYQRGLFAAFAVFLLEEVEGSTIDLPQESGDSASAGSAASPPASTSSPYPSASLHGPQEQRSAAEPAEPAAHQLDRDRCNDRVDETDVGGQRVDGRDAEPTATDGSEAGGPSSSASAPKRPSPPTRRVTLIAISAVSVAVAGIVGLVVVTNHPTSHHKAGPSSTTPSSRSGSTGRDAASTAPGISNLQPGAPRLTFNALGSTYSKIIDVYPGVRATPADRTKNGTFESGNVVRAVCIATGRPVRSDSRYGETRRSSDQWVRIDAVPGVVQYATLVYADVSPAAGKLPRCTRVG